MTQLLEVAQVNVEILVADASRMQCELLADALRRQRNLRVAGCAVDSTEVLRSLQEHETSIALISADLQDGPRAGIQVLRKLCGIGCRTRPIVLIDRSERDLVVEAFRNGAKGIFCRSQPFEALHKCIRSVHRGQIWATSKELHYILEALREPGPLHIVDAKGVLLLTKREEEVAWLLSEGLSNREIAERLKLSEHTIKNYLFRIFEKLGVSNRLGLVLYVLSHRTSQQSRAS